MVKRSVVDLAVTGDWTPATGDTKISKDGGAQANTTNNPAIASGVSWKLTLTATEMSAKYIVVMIVDSATKAVEDQFIIILTYGNASAMFPGNFPDITFPTNFASMAIDANGRVDLSKVNGSAINNLISGRVDANTQALANNVITSSILAADAIGASQIATDAIGAAEIAAAAVNKIVDEVWNRLLTAITTSGSIGKLIKDNLDALISSRAPASDWTPTRAGYLDKLNISGNVASSSEVTAIQNNTRVVRVVPEIIERPDSGTTTYRVELFLYDETGNMEAPDSAPTIELVNQSGTDRSSRLDSTTMALVETGRYRAIYTASSGDALEQLVWAFSVVEGGVTRKYGNASLIVDTTAVDFTSADRAKLDTLHDTRLTSARAANLDNLDALVSSRLPTSSYTAPPSAASVADAVWDEAAADHNAAGTTGEKLNTAGGDMWATALPGSYLAGSAGKILGDRLDVKVSSRQPIGTGSRSVTIRTRSGGLAVAGQLLTVKNQAGTDLVAYGVTNTSGEIVVMLDDGTYQVRVGASPAFEPLDPVQIVVTGDNTFIIDLTAQEPSPPASPQLCRVYGFVYNAQGVPAAGVEVKFTLKTSGVAEMGSPGTAFLNKAEVTAQTDATGQFFADVLRSSQINPWTGGDSVKYQFSCPTVGISVEITVPDADTYNLVTALP